MITFRSLAGPMNRRTIQAIQAGPVTVLILLQRRPCEFIEYLLSDGMMPGKNASITA